MMIKLWVDDVRKAPLGWHLVKTITEAIRLLHTHEIEEISLDHDICHSENDVYKIACSENYSAIAYYMASMPEKFKSTKIYIHTQNSWGARNMQSILAEAGLNSEIKHASRVVINKHGVIEEEEAINTSY